MKKPLKILVFAFLVLCCIPLNAQDSKEGIVRTYITENLTTLNVSASDVNDWIVQDEYLSKKSQTIQLHIKQRYGGVEVYNGTANFSIKDDKVIFVGNSLVADLAEKVSTTTPSLSVEEAIASAAVQLDIPSPSGITLLETVATNSYIYDAGAASQEKVPVKLVLQPVEEGTLKIAWDLALLTPDGNHWWNVRVDATTGQIISKNDWMIKCSFDATGKHNHTVKENTQNFDLFTAKNTTNSTVAETFAGETYNVFPMPLESPNHGSNALVFEPQNTLASPFGWHDTDGVAGPEYTITRGNNVYAQEDRNGNNGFGYAPDGGAGLNFNFPFNANSTPLEYIDASLTNLFYWNNIMHDVWYQYGFDEASGNFQENNYGRGGTGGDYVIADGQDRSLGPGGGQSFNNANFATPSEGFRPRMQMFLWSEPRELTNPLTIDTGTIAGQQFNGVDTNYRGVSLPSTPISGNLVIADDGLDNTDDACSALLPANAALINGNIAVIRRGDCNFTDKVINAQNAGATAVIMINNVLGDPIVMGGDNVNITIPAIMVSLIDGTTLINAINAGGVTATLQSNGPFYRDGDFDAGIVSHEYGHGISVRLTGGAIATGCLSNDEQMGEGWSDWFGLMLTMQAGDLATDARGIGTYGSGQPTTGGGIRQFPYTTDTSVNPFTYGDVGSQTIGGVVSVHGVGSIWGTILWDLTWAYVDKYGFDPDFYNGTGGNNRVMQVVIDGLKMQACAPGFVDGRDAIIAADNALTGGEDFCLIWEVFAARGVGANAIQGSSDTIGDEIENFSLPYITPPASCTSALSVDEFAKSQLSIYPNPSNGIVNITSSATIGDVTISVFDLNGRNIFTEDVNLQRNYTLKLNNLQAGLYVLKIQGDEFFKTTKIVIE